MVCKLLTIVEAVMQHPDVPTNRVGNLKLAKEGLYDVTSSLAESVRLLTVSLPSSMSEEAEKQVLLRSATGAVQAAADCVAAVKVCLTRSISDIPFVVNLPTVDNVMTRLMTPVASSTQNMSQSR
jgi:son of sevenless-like protein